jgi:chromodomain-helicase-DNA-binding protein 7
VGHAFTGLLCVAGNSPAGSRNSRKSKKKAKELRQLSPGGGEDSNQEWSRDEKYDGDIFLESNYKKHLTRHSNK